MPAPGFVLFGNVVHLGLGLRDGFGTSRPLTPLHGLSPMLKSLSVSRISAPLSEVFDFIYSFHSLEYLMLDLSTTHNTTDTSQTFPSTSPKFTGTILLGMTSGVQSTIRRFLDLPGGQYA